MLFVKTDLTQTGWLTYLLEEFRRIQAAEFDIEIVGIHHDTSGHPTITYTPEPDPDHVSVYRAGPTASVAPIRFLGEKIFVPDDVISSRKDFSISYDLFWSAFVFLSRLEEYLFEKNGRLIKSYSSNHPRAGKDTFRIPVVNYLFFELQNRVEHSFPTLHFTKPSKPVVEFSHDIDYVKKTVQHRIKQSSFCLYNTLLCVGSPRHLIAGLFRASRFMFSGCSYWNAEFWTDLEKRHGVRSIFYAYAKCGSKTIRSWLIDPSYSIATDALMKQRLRRLTEDGFSVGLHGSLRAAYDQHMLSLEKKSLSQVLGSDITHLRFHWLSFREQQTPGVTESLFSYDSTIGWIDVPGYRAGIASQYRPYNHAEGRPFNFLETPVVLIDSHLFDYDCRGSRKASEFAADLLPQLSTVNNAHVSINWHQRVVAADYQWHAPFVDILSSYASQNPTLDR